MDIAALPFLTAYDPPGAGEGTLDPLGLYQIADRLATRLVPGVRERMQRIRFLTVMALGAKVTEAMGEGHRHAELPPFLVWEWLVVEALVRAAVDGRGVQGVPGTLVTRRALVERGHLDRRSYLKTPQIFGFHGVYKRLALRLRLADVHLGLRAESERLIEAWAKDARSRGLAGLRPLFDKWKSAVERSMTKRRTDPGWLPAGWNELAKRTAPDNAGRREKRTLRELLHADDDRQLGALPVIWTLQSAFDDEDYSEEELHRRMKRARPSDAPLLDAIAAYERFCRGLTDAFHVLQSAAGAADSHGFEIAMLRRDGQAVLALRHLNRRYKTVCDRLGKVDPGLARLFSERFARFGEPMRPADAALAMCEHHEEVQKGKSADGKRPWFDRLGPDRIYMRHRYREPRRPIEPDRYVHDYRGKPIRTFYRDLL